MKAIETLRAMGYTFALSGGGIDYKFGGQNPPSGAARLFAEVRRRKSWALKYLAARWPAESADYEERFRPGSPRLYPFLKRLVLTPHGEATLLSVGGDSACVAFERTPRKAVMIPWEEAIPA